MKILLIGNYAHDRQESMLRFADMLASGLRQHGHEARLIAPRPLVGRLAVSSTGAGKWLGYVDKFLLFPRHLAREVAWADLAHICDHSNSPYTAALLGTPHVVTCHDLLAVRGGLGEETDCPASPAGKLLQRWILRGLKRARMIVCDSAATRADLLRLGGNGMASRSEVILLGLNHPFQKLAPEEAAARLSTTEGFDVTKPFLLMVGSSQRRKNREGALRILDRVRQEWDGSLVFAGTALTPAQHALAAQLGLRERLVEVMKPSHAVLEALYNCAFALLFPSRFEGFGWPVLEAQACGCPVLCSDATSVPEVAGNGAWSRAPADEEGFAADILRLRNAPLRSALIARGFENVARFTSEQMMAKYLEVYKKVCAVS